MCGKPVILIENGRILQNNLRSTRVTLDELTELLREKDVLDLRSVQYAILETNGNLSVFPYPKFQPASAMAAGVEVKKQALPYTVIADGYLYRDNLQLSGKDDRWLQSILRQNDTDIASTWLLTVDDMGKVLWLKKEEAS